MKIAFDTNCISYMVYRLPQHQPEASCLDSIFRGKRKDWSFFYLDVVKRELVGGNLDRMHFEKQAEKIISQFDHRLMSRFPAHFPMTPGSQTDIDRQVEFEELAKSNKVSLKDSRVLSDAIGAHCDALVSVDGPLNRNQWIKSYCEDKYQLSIWLPSMFVAEFLPE